MSENVLNEFFENEQNVSNQENNKVENLDEIQIASFLKVSELKLKCRARNLRLKEDDVIVAVDGEDTDTQFSGKAGVGVPVTDAIGVYGELSFLTADDEDDFGVGGKLGLKYNF